MKKEQRNSLLAALCALAAFTLWTVALKFVDVEPIGPRGSSVGFAALNGFVHDLTGVHMGLYTVTDWLGLVPVAFGFAFAILGLVQWIRRKKIWTVDRDILVLGGFYILVLATYLLFETVVINYRPVLINDYLEVSYPSSTTLLVLTVMPTAKLQLRSRIRNPRLRTFVCAAISLFWFFMIVGRLISGVHWLTDIIGGIFLGAGLTQLYKVAANLS